MKSGTRLPPVGGRKFLFVRAVARRALLLGGATGKNRNLDRMPESSHVNPAEPGLEIRTSFVRTRNALIAKADFGQLYVDFFLHLSDHAIKLDERHAEMFKRALAGFALHCASRPRNEMVAWTVNVQDPLVNLFLVGDNSEGSVAGRIFAENVKQLPKNQFFSDTVVPGKPKRRSSVEFTGADPLAGVEQYYRQSEQRPARFFQTAEEEFVLVAAHPDYDEAWFEALTVEQVRDIDRTEQLGELEKRVCRWHCGCNQQRILQVLQPVFLQDPAGLFDGEEVVEIRCPRCAGRYVITREAMEAYVAEHPGK